MRAMANKDDRNAVQEGGPNPSLILGIVIALAAIDFIAQNRVKVDIHFLFFTFKANVWVALLITSALAIVAAELVSHHLRRSRRR
jgi:uncharacterized integral membrane protein